MARQSFLPVALLLAVVAFAACSGPSATLEDMPEWMAEKPESNQSLLGTGTAASDGLQTALEKAETRARGDIASTVEVRFQGLTTDFQEEVSAECRQQFVQAQKQVTNQFLRGTQARERTIREEEGRYRAYVLMEMPIGQASQELMSKLRASDDLYTRFRASEAFEALQNEIEKYEARKRKQSQWVSFHRANDFGDYERSPSTLEPNSVEPNSDGCPTADQPLTSACPHLRAFAAHVSGSPCRDCTGLRRDRSGRHGQ